jgi:4-amino-4-deoxy-L-arabinose transferase-like glycosyltransferase
MTEMSGRAQKQRGPERSAAGPVNAALLALACVLALALALRIVGLFWGLPNDRRFFSFHPDEAPILLPVSNILTANDWNPHFFNYGTFYIYLVTIAATLSGLQGGWSDWAALHLVARVVSALFGTATVLVVYLIGKEMAGAWTGILAALVLAVMPMHVVHSHYATVDAVATFFLALALWAMVRLTEECHPIWYAIAGAAVGLGAATKYSAGVAFLPIILGHLTARGTSRMPHPPARFLLISAAAAALFFWVACPYVFMSKGGLVRLNPEFLRDAGFEMRHMRGGGTFAFVNTGSGWAYHLMHSLPAGLGYCLVIFALAGLFFLPRAHGPGALVTLGFAALYFGIIGAAQERFLRYTLLLAPIFALSCAALVTQVAAMGRRWRAASVALALAAVVPTFLYSLGQVQLMSRPDVREKSGRWLKGLLPGNRLGMVYTPWYFTPEVIPYNGGERTRALFERWLRDAPFRVVITGWEARRLGSSKPDFFAISDEEYMHPVRIDLPGARDFMSALERHYEQRKVFAVRPMFAQLGPSKARCPPDWLYTWPRIEIYSGWR